MDTHQTRLITRRRALQIGAGAGLLGAGALVAGPPAAATSGVFRHGVASGDPLPRGVIVWTRVTPDARSTPGSGAGPVVTVAWQVALDPRFQRIARSGTYRTGPWRDHTVKVDVTDLQPGRTYWYRFRLGGQTSPVGRTRTAPAAGAAVERLRMGVVSCSNWQAGYFAAYRHLAARDDLDLVLHLGDYLYEYPAGEYGAGEEIVRRHDPAVEITRLGHYRRRHAQYKTDPDLQALHAAAPWVVTWDDHESANDAWRDGAENHTPGAEGDWATRRRWSQEAYAEWMPVRYDAGGRLFRRLRFGRLASISMLDLRTYRDQQVASPVDPERDDPDRTITGAPQMDFLLDGLADRSVQWKLVGNPVMITPVRFPNDISAEAAAGVAELVEAPAPPVRGVPYNVDQWDGYEADQERVIGHLRDRGISDAVFLTGDIHSGWACDLPADDTTYRVDGASVGNELVCTSVTSDNLDEILGQPEDSPAVTAVEESFKANNPHVKYLDFARHGYSVLDVTPERTQMDWYVLADRTRRDTPATFSTAWAIPAGTRKVQPSPGPIA